MSARLLLDKLMPRDLERMEGEGFAEVLALIDQGSAQSER